MVIGLLGGQAIILWLILAEQKNGLLLRLLAGVHIPNHRNPRGELQPSSLRRGQEKEILENSDEDYERVDALGCVSRGRVLCDRSDRLRERAEP